MRGLRGRVRRGAEKKRKEAEGVKYSFSALLPETVRTETGELPDDLAELRLRTGQPAELVRFGGSELRGNALSAAQVAQAAQSLSGHSLYAREEELREGFFTVEGGCRVGVCGRMSVHADGTRTLTHISSVCVRVSRAVEGAADGVMDALYSAGKARSALVISPPGLGKTTLLRDIARQLSDKCGCRVGIADERGELAGCVLGVPSLNVGRRSDVMDGCPKRIAMYLLTRAMSPEVIVTDELGHSEDAQAVLDVMRCGVQVIASVHAADAVSAARRLSGLDIECFDCLIVLGGGIGQVREIIKRR